MILEGVSAHLESSLEEVRLDGMRVAEAFAQVMGQPLKFDELQGKRYVIDPDVTLAVTTVEPQDGLNDIVNRDKGEGDGRDDKEEDVDMLQPYDMSDDEIDLGSIAPARYLTRIIECKSCLMLIVFGMPATQPHQWSYVLF